MLTRHFVDIMHILPKSQLFQSLGNMFTRDSLLALFLRDLVRFAGNEGYEFDTAFDEEVAGVFAEGETG